MPDKCGAGDPHPQTTNMTPLTTCAVCPARALGVLCWAAAAVAAIVTDDHVPVRILYVHMSDVGYELDVEVKPPYTTIVSLMATMVCRYSVGLGVPVVAVLVLLVLLERTVHLYVDILKTNSVFSITPLLYPPCTYTAPSPLVLVLSAVHAAAPIDMGAGGDGAVSQMNDLRPSSHT